MIVHGWHRAACTGHSGRSFGPALARRSRI